MPSTWREGAEGCGKGGVDGVRGGLATLRRESLFLSSSHRSSGNLALHSPAAAAKRFHIKQKDGFVVPLNSDGKITQFFSCYLFFFLVLFESEGTVFEARLPISFSKAALSAHHMTSEQIMGGGSVVERRGCQSGKSVGSE